MAGCGGRGAPCPRLLQEMKAIPAKFLPTSVKMSLSMILDPPLDLPDNDYRFFAERNGVIPQTWKWLDSQKGPSETSSIIKVLDHLVARDKDRFTVFQVYHTLCQMKSDGQRVICDGMPEVRRLYHQGTRQGQEDTEPSSSSSFSPNIPSQAPSHPTPPPSHPSPPRRTSSHPPPYNEVEGSMTLNDLNGGGQNGSGRSLGKLEGAVPPLSEHGPVHVWRRFACEISDGGSQASGNVVGPAESSFDSALNRRECGPENGQAGGGGGGGGRAAEECTFPSCEENVLVDAPPTYVESQRQHGHEARQERGELPQPPTQMEDLKLPFDGLEVSVGGGSIPGQGGGSVPRQGGGSVVPGQGGGSGPGQTAGGCSSSGASGSNMRKKNQSPMPLLSALYRPFSFPNSESSSSYKSRPSSVRPFSDAVYCTHTGACNCPSFIAPSVAALGMSDLPSPHQWCYRDSPPGSAVSEAVSDVSAEGQPWNERWHQTEVKQPLARHGEGSLPPSRCHSLPAPASNPSHGTLRRQLSIPAQLSGRNGSSSSRFVFVVAADMEETDHLDSQVDVFCQSLVAWGISYVVVKSTCEWPLIHLPERVLDKLPRLKKDFKSVQEFIWACYKRASKVLMLVSPGYLRYADAYTQGAEVATTHQQKVMRKIQEKLKSEFFDQKRTFRIWPVLLQELKANRVHVPSFLGHSVFYWFPCTPGLENLMDILKEDLTTARSSNVKRSF